MAGRARRTRPRGRLLHALTVGDRLYVLLLLGLVAIAIGMALGPLQVFTAAADRVDRLEEERDRLDGEVEELEDRQDRLQDPSEIERLARSELGLVRPGEIPFVVVVPEDADGEPGAAEDDADLPWYRRIGRWLSDRLGGGD